MAVNAVAERVLGRKDDRTRAPIDHQTDADSRFVALQNQIDGVSDAQVRQINALTATLRVISVRVSIALWLSVASAIMAFVLLLVVVFRS